MVVNNNKSTIEIEIKATDTSSEVIAKASEAFNDLNSKTETVSETFGTLNESTNLLTKGINLSKDAADQASSAITAVGVAAETSGSKLVEFFGNLAQIVDTIYTIGSSQPVQETTNVFLAQAEEATKELVELNILLEGLGGFAPPLLEGLFDTAEDGFKTTFEFLNNLPEGINLIDTSVRKLDNFLQKSFTDVGNLFRQTGDILGENGLQIIDTIDIKQVYGDVKNLINLVNTGIDGIVQEIAFFEQSLQSITSIAQTGTFKLLIGQSIELQEQLLATRSSLVGTSKILNFGSEIQDPTEAIKALEQPISSAIERMKIESLDLVGVTSKELVPVFRLVAQNITAIGASLDDAKDLTLDFAASLGTLGIPLFQAEQEIDSILTGQIDMNSVLAQNLNLTNEQVNKWKGEGQLVENLRKRLEAFRAGNALAAKSFGGVTSNIQEVIDLIGQRAGASLLEPLVEQLTKVYDFLQANFDGFVSYAEEISKHLLIIFNTFAEIIGEIVNATKGIASQIPIYLFESLSHVVKELGIAIKFTLNLLEPVINSFTALATTVGGLGSPFFRILFGFVAMGKATQILGDGFRKVIKRMDGMGEILDILEVRTNVVGQQFGNLTQVFGKGASAALLLGKNLESIPFLMEALKDKLGPLGGLIAPMIPSISTLGIQIGGLITMFPALGGVLLGVVSILPQFLNQLAVGANTASLFGVSLAPVFTPLIPAINKASAEIQKFSQTQDKATLINDLFAKGLRIAGREITKIAIKMAVISGAFYLAFLAIDKFILKNKELLEVFNQITTGVGLVFELLLNKWTIGFAAVSAACTALVFAIQGQLIPAIVKLIATQLAGVFTVAAGAATFFAGALGALGLTAVAAQATALATGLTTMATAFTAAGGGMSAFAAGLSQVVAMTLALLGPILIIGAAVAGIGWLAYQQGAKDSAAASEEFRKQTNAVSDASLELANKLKAAKDKQAEADQAGIRLADKEYENNKRLANQAKLRISLIEDEIKAREEAKKKAIGKENKANYDVQIAELNKMKELLTDLSTNVTIQPKDLPQLGTGLEQLRKKADQAWNAIERPSGDASIFKQKAEEVIEFQTALLDMGDVIDEDVIPKLRQLAQDTRLDEGTQKKAADAILNIIKNEADEELNILSRQKAEIEALEAQSLISSGEKEKQLSALTVKELKIRKQVAKDQQAELESFNRNEEAEEKAEEILKIEAEISKEFASELDRRNKKLLESFQKRIDIIEGALAEGEASEEFYNNRSKALKLQELDEEEKQLRAKADKQGEYSESTLAELAKLQVERQKILSEGYSAELNLLEQTLQESVDLVAQAEADRQAKRLRAFQDEGGDIAQMEVDATADSLATQMAEYEKAQALLAQMELQAPLSDPRLEAKRQADIRKARIDTANQAIGLIQTEQDAWQKNTDLQINNLNRATTTQLTGLQARVNAGEELAETLATIESIGELESLQIQLENEKDITKQAEIQLEIEKQKSAIQDSQIAQAQAELDLVQNTALESQIRAANDGIILKGALQVTIAQQQIEDLQTQLELETDIAKIAELRVSLAEAENNLQDAENTAILQQLELEQTNELNEITKELNDGKLLGAEVDLFRLDQSIDKLNQQIALEEDQVELAKLKLQLTEALEQRENSANALELQRLELNQSEELLQIIERVNDGKSLSSQLSVEESKNTIESLEKELELEDDIVKIAQLKIQLAKAREDLEEENKGAIAQQNELVATEKLIELTKAYNAGNLLAIELDIAGQEQKIKTLEQQLELEDDLLERKLLILELEEAREDLEDQIIEKRIRINDLAYKREIIALKKSLYAGLKTKEEVELAKAEATLRRIQIELEAEDDIEKKLSLQEQLVDAINDKTQAQVELYASKINKELEEYNLFIKEANRELEIQTKYIDRIRESFGMQQQLYDAQSKVYSAATGFYIGELEALKATTKNKREQAEIDEIIAGLRFEAALKQVEFDRISLQLKQEMLKIEQERAVLQQQMAVNQAKMDAEQAKANAQIVTSNPQATPLERKIAEQEARFAEQNVQFAEESLKLIQQQGTLQEALFQKEQEAFDYEAKARTRSAESSAIGAIQNRGVRRQAQKAQAEDIINDFGFDDKKDLISSGISRSRSNLVDRGLLNGKGGTRINDEDMIRQLRGEDSSSGATLSAKDEIFRIMGSAGNITSPTPTNVNATPISLPGMDSVIAPVLNPLTEIQNTIASLNPLIDQASKPNNVNLSPNLTFNINAPNGVGNSIRSEVQPQIKNILDELMVLSR